MLAGTLWADHGLVFASAVGTPLDRHNVLREFRKITQAAGLGTDWVPREMRHTFVSAAQRSMAERTGATVTEVPGRHSIYVSRPQAVATLIKQAAAAT